MAKFTKAITIDSITSKSSKSTGLSMAASTAATSMTSASKNVLDLRIRTVKASEYKAAAACLADAFSEDEIATYFLDCPDTASWSRQRKWALHVKILEGMTMAHIKCGLVHAIGDPKSGGGSFDAVALWMPPNSTMDGWSTVVKTGLWRQWAQVGWQLSKEGRVRFFKEFVPLLHSTKLEVLKERDPTSWYLVYIGTHIRARGKGLAKRLINEVTSKADLESRACYLESSNLVNVPIYKKLGFEPIKRIHLRRNGKTADMDIMVREPATAEPFLLTAAKRSEEENAQQEEQIEQTPEEVVAQP